jgi:hypothetical protein
MYKLVLFIVGSVMFAACSSGSDTIDYDTKARIDSLTGAGNRLVDLEIKSFCQDSTGAIVKHLADSLIIIRLAERERIIGQEELIATPEEDDE